MRWQAPSGLPISATTVMKPEAFPSHGNQAWIAEHRAGLRCHLAQCWTRCAWLTVAQGLGLMHHTLGRRFATTVLTATALMLMPMLWL